MHAFIIAFAFVFAIAIVIVILSYLSSSGRKEKKRVAGTPHTHRDEILSFFVIFLRKLFWSSLCLNTLY
jgi:cell division septal protein FtsQ